LTLTGCSLRPERVLPVQMAVTAKQWEDVPSVPRPSPASTAWAQMSPPGAGGPALMSFSKSSSSSSSPSSSSSSMPSAAGISRPAASSSSSASEADSSAPSAPEVTSSASSSSVSRLKASIEKKASSSVGCDLDWWPRDMGRRQTEVGARSKIGCAAGSQAGQRVRGSAAVAAADRYRPARERDRAHLRASRFDPGASRSVIRR
jgi:hypothetical protein